MRPRSPHLPPSSPLISITLLLAALAAGCMPEDPSPSAPPLAPPGGGASAPDASPNDAAPPADMTPEMGDALPPDMTPDLTLDLGDAPSPDMSSGLTADIGEALPPDMTPDLTPDVGGAPPDLIPDMTPASVCGDGVRAPDEMCDEPDPECVNCAIPCSYRGGRACGGNTIPGDPQLLYECDGAEFVVIEDCGEPCERMPPGVPDRCPEVVMAGEPPQRLLDTLRVNPYVEQSCTPTTFAGWPYEARRCSYTTGGLPSVVVTATPSARRVALWIMDSVTLIPALDSLKGSDPASYTEGLVMIAVAVLNQSSRIFPLSGDIVENLGGGYTRYPFDRGVTAGCSSGCYCRINSLHRTEWCAYEASLGGSESACLDRVGRSGLTRAWGDHCLQNHINAWESERNEHFRARAYRYQQSVRGRCPRAGSCSGREVLAALRGAI